MLCVPSTALAQEDEANEVKIIPYSQRDPALPHPAHSTARMTLKAMIRNANCNAGYDVWWDTNFNDNFDDDQSRRVTKNNTTEAVWDIGRGFLVPDVNGDSSLNINVRVRNLCNSEDKFATFRLYVYDFIPSNDPLNWTDEQIEIMSQMGIQESLWHIHRTMSSFSARNTTLEAHDQYAEATGISLWLFTVNGHLPAYPPNAMGDFGDLNNLPETFIDDNSERWHNDPYAESAMRFANYLVARGALRGIPGGEEETECGYTPDMQVRVNCGLDGAGRLDNPGENLGAYAKGTANVYRMGVALGGLATVLPALNNTPLRVGNNNIRGGNWEWFIQQMVDQLGAQQIDCGDGEGGWLYGDFNGCGNAGHSDASTTQWSYIGLESAEIAGGPYGVFVNNRHKYRIAQNLIRNQRGDGAAGYRSSSGRGDFKLTGGSLVGARWLGIHQFGTNDGALAFPGRSNHSRGTLRQSYDRYVAHLAQNWNNRLSVGSHWADSMWREGDHTCGNRNAVYNAGRCGSSYAMYSLQKGFRTGQPELEQVGNHDWVREFNSYYLRAQDRHHNGNDPWANYSVQGRILDSYCDNHSVTCSYGGGRLALPMGGLVLTPSLFNPKPVPIAHAVPDEVTEGCAGANNGLVTFDHADSFHPNAESRIVAYRWDVNADDGLWWEGDGDPDFETPDADGNLSDTFEFQYPRAGAYTATLQVVDNFGQSKEKTVNVRVIPAENVPPAVAHGGPYVGEAGQAIELEGAADDGNLGCGDNLNIVWFIDGDNQPDAQGATPTIPWAFLQNLDQDAPNRIRVRATDESGASADAETTLRIFPAEPVAAGRANPNPAACNQAVVFDGNASFHPNPQRSIAQYDWNVDGVAGFDGGGARFNYTYDAFGEYTVTLRVTDDLGRTDTTEIEVNVDQGNRQPVARIAEASYVVLEGDDLVLDGRASSDDDAECGDEIVEYAWDIDGNGRFNDNGIDVRGANPTVDWQVLADNMEWPADRNTGLPTNTITLRVTDRFGAQATVDATVSLFEARPLAEISQRPNPSPISRNGLSQTTLDGGESISPVPGVAIVGYEWVFDQADRPGNNPELDSEEQAVNFVKVFDPVPGPENIPDVFVWLRVTDDTGRQSQWTRYTVEFSAGQRPPPTADADPTDPPEQNYHILVGQGVTLDGSQSFGIDADDAQAFIQFYRWDLTYNEADGFDPHADTTVEDADGDGAEAQIQIDAAALANTHGIDGEGTYVVRLQVEDNFGVSNTDDAQIIVHPRDPTARMTANPNPAACGARVTFDASRSAHPHPAVNIDAYRWDLDGDGEFDDADGDVVTNRFNQFTFGNDITVGVEVEDSNGNTATASVDIDVSLGNRAPAGVAGGFRDDNGRVVGPYAISPGDGVTFNAEGSADPDEACGDQIVSYQWDINGDGDFGDAAGVEVELTWQELQALGINDAGDRVVSLRVTDRFGASNDSVADFRVVVGPTAVAQANPNRTGCENQVTFSGEQSSTDGPDGQGFEIVSYAWDLDGDGEYDDAEGARFTQAAVGLPGNDGVIRIRAGLQVTDASGRTATAETEVQIDVQNLAPQADPGGPYATGPLLDSFSPVRLDGRASSDPNQPCDQLVVYKWDVDGDGNYGRDGGDDDPVGAVIEYVNDNWRINTVQTVRLIVCDGLGECSRPGEAEIAVLGEAPPSGEVLSPRADDNVCIGSGEFDIDLRISDPAGDLVTVSVFIDGEVVGEENVETNPDGSPVDVTITVDADEIPEGRHFIDVYMDDGNGGEAESNSGGRLTFDRTGPTVAIGNQLRDAVCYNPNQIPDPDIEIDDEYDLAPRSAQELLEEGCGRTLRVTATDACGNTGTADRAFLVAQAVGLEIDGIEEGELTAEARISWSIVGPEACASRVEATLTQDGGNPQPYQANALINEGGSYSLNVQVANCLGVPRVETRNFTINSPPVAVPVPAGHPGLDPEDQSRYLVAEGGNLRVDASESRPPEQEDNIVRYEWDFDGDGNYDAEGSSVNFPTEEDGIYDARLRLTDSLGATTVERFEVAVTDVDPIPEPGGPYVIGQGEEAQFDASGSRPGSDADAIVSYGWDFDGDGEIDEQGAQVSQVFAENGIFNVRLTVTDEDSSTTVVVRVEVRDVDPEIREVTLPENTYEIVPMTFTVDAEAGSPGDPITRIEWDFYPEGEPDNEVDASGANAFEISHQFEEGALPTDQQDGRPYHYTVTVFDGDSESTVEGTVYVAEITLTQLVEYIGTRFDAAIADEDLGADNPLVVRDLARANGSLQRALWGERYGFRGNTIAALTPVVDAMVDTHATGAIDWGLELWALGRQMVRETTRLRAQILEEEPTRENDPVMQRANASIRAMLDIYEDENFRTDANSLENAGVVSALYEDSVQAYYWLQDIVDACSSHDVCTDANFDYVCESTIPDGVRDRFPLPCNPGVTCDGFGLSAQTDEHILPAMVEALEDLRDEMNRYVASGVDDDDTGVGRDDVQNAANTLTEMIAIARLPVQFPCPDGTRCVTDREAYEMEVAAMDLIESLTLAGNNGVWVSNWQNCLVSVLRFRIELSLLRVESICGRGKVFVQQARNAQSTGLEMISEFRYPAALDFYREEEQRCLMAEVFNGCFTNNVIIYGDDIDGDEEGDPIPCEADADCNGEVCFNDVCRVGTVEVPEGCVEEEE